MGRSKRCGVVDCVNNYLEYKKKNLSFHEFPSNPVLRKKWFRKLLPYLDPYYCQRELTFICGDHFRKEDFRPSKKKILTRTAVPSIFNTLEPNDEVTSDPLKLTEGGAVFQEQDVNESERINDEKNNVNESNERREQEKDKENENCFPYLFTSVKISKEDGQEDICRVCFQPAPRHKKLTDSHVTRTQTYKEMLEFLKVDINFNFYPDPVICMNCVMLLLIAFDFKRRCHRTERSLHRYLVNQESDKPTDLIILDRKKKNESDEITIKIDQSANEPAPLIDAILDHDYVATNDDPIEEIQLTVEPAETSEESESVSLSEPTKYKRITIWGDPPYLCDMCGRTFETKRQCRRHLYAHRIQKETVDSYYCAICQCTYGNINVAVHLNSHKEKKYECEECGRRFKHTNLLINHIQSAHEAEQDATCDVCGKSLPRKQLRAHVARHFATKDAKCHICDKMMYRCRLKQHIRSHSASRKRCVCHICGKTVGACFIKGHLWRHNNDFKVKCTVCEVGFSSERELRLHLTRKKHIRNLMLNEVIRKEKGEEAS